MYNRYFSDCYKLKLFFLIIFCIKIGRLYLYNLYNRYKLSKNYKFSQF